jgi:hypothetical protein
MTSQPRSNLKKRGDKDPFISELDNTVHGNTIARRRAKRKQEPPADVWTSAEDLLLTELANKNGDKSWYKIARQIGTKNPTECMNRWFTHLKPGYCKKGTWSEEEDRILKKWVRETPFPPKTKIRLSTMDHSLGQSVQRSSTAARASSAGKDGSIPRIPVSKREIGVPMNRTESLTTYWSIAPVGVSLQRI